MATTVENKFGSTVHISKFDAESFKPVGRREFLAYRDLGIGSATNGAVGAVISRSSDPGQNVDVTTGWHYHICDLQVFYIIRGWIDIEFEGTGVLRLEAGSCVNIPPGVIHNEIAIAPENEILEITIPPKIETIAVSAP